MKNLFHCNLNIFVKVSVKYEDIEDMWKQDSILDPENLDSESLRIPLLHSKYFSLLVRERAVLRKLHLDLDQLKHWKREYFQGQIPHEELLDKGIPIFSRMLVKSELDVFVDADSDVRKVLEKIAVAQSKVDFLDLCVKSLNNRTFFIKNAIDYLKFKNGML